MSNFPLGDFVNALNIARLRRFKSININLIMLNFRLCEILEVQGVIRGFRVFVSYIRVYLKYYFNDPVYYRLFLVSLPSKRVYCNLNQLSILQGNNSCNTFFIVSTSLGLMSSFDCLLLKRISGEILLKVQI